MGSFQSMDLDLLESLIRSGKGNEARDALLQIKPGSLSLSQSWKAAALCRRVSLYSKGLEILREPFFEQRSLSNPNQNICAEYAALLTEVGATKIAHRVFSLIKNPSDFTLFYLGLHKMKQWDYESAEKDFENFLKVAPEAYWKRIGLLNLAACFVFNRKFIEAKHTLAQLTAESEQLSPMILGSMNELAGQIHFFEGNNDKAREHFQASFEKLKASENPAAIFAEKWIFICRMTDKSDFTVEQDVLEFQNRIRERGLWEIFRELDRFKAQRRNDMALLHKLYFGTPHLAYRNMLMRDFNYQPPTHFSYELKNTSASKNILNLGTMEFKSSSRVFQKFPSSAKKLLSGLLHDLYRPVPVGSLFELLFPNEYFDPEFGPQKTYQAIKRFRALCSKENLPFEIQSSDLGFSLQVTDDVLVEYDNHGEFSKRESVDSNLLNLIRRHFVDEDFSMSDLAKHTKQSQRTLNRYLAVLVQNNKIEVFGEGRARLYRLKTSTKAAA